MDVILANLLQCCLQDIDTRYVISDQLILLPLLDFNDTVYGKSLF
jgi:hypothetical protein